MAVGKTTTGAALAQRLDRPFLDNDAGLRELTGATPADLYAEGGEAAVHAGEGKVLAMHLANEEPAVVATAGSAVLEPVGRAALSSHWVVWLRAQPPTVHARIGRGGHRPPLVPDLADVVAMVEQRSPLYAAVADLTVDVDGREVDELVAEILAAAPADVA